MKFREIINKILSAIAVVTMLNTASETHASPQPAFIDNYNVGYVTAREGLANNNLDDIFKDSDGFLWIAFTGGGLSRFDGYDFVNFSPNSQRYHIKSGFVKNVVEDKFHRLWVASEGGLDVIDLSTLTDGTPKGADSLLTDISENNILSVYCDTKGKIWLNTDSDIHCIKFNDRGEIITSATMPCRGNSHMGLIARDVEENGSVWIGISGTVNRVTLDHNGKLSTSRISENLTALPDVEYFSDFVARENEVWISTDRGLYRYDTVKDLVKHYVHESGNETSLSQNFLTDIAVTGDKQLLIASLRGLNIYNPLKDCFERMHNELNNQFINMILTDGETILIATEGGGINRLTPRRLNYSFYKNQPNNPESLSPNPVNAIAYGSDGSLFAGTVEGGLNRRLPHKRGFIHYTVADGILSHNSVSALAIDNEDRLWVGTWGGGIDVLFAHSPEIVLNHIHELDISGAKLSYIGSLIYDPKNYGMWIGSNQGLLFYDCNDGQLSSIIAPVDNSHMYGFIGAAIDSNNLLWEGCAAGLLSIDLNNRKPDGTFPYTIRPYKLDDPESKTAEHVSCIFEDRDKTLWIGSSGHGIYKRIISNGKEHFINYTTDNGLANNTVKGIIQDESGKIWVTTVSGLSCLKPGEEHFISYTCPDELPDDQFYWNATYKTPDGKLLLGTTCGLLEINPDNIYERISPSPRIVFTQLYVANQPVTSTDSGIIDGDISNVSTVRIHESDKSVSLKFAALDYGDNSDAIYSYMLEGFDRDWITVDNNRRYAAYTNLPPGTYRLLVRYAPDHTSAFSDPAIMTIKVKPYFYRTTWFICLAALILVLIIFGVYRSRIKELTLQRQLLTSEVARQTSELAEQKSVAENHVIELAEQNRILTDQNNEILRQKAKLSEMNEQVKTMTMDRISFFTNITHEFRTPITLIIGPIERALKLSTNPKVIEQLHFVERNSKYLLSLINQLMDFRKVEAGKIELSQSLGYFPTFINGLVDTFRQLVDDRHITIRRVLRLPHREFVYDEEALRKVITNLLSNAIKFTPDGGSITVYAAAKENADDEKAGTLYLCVSDSGEGIAESEIPRIFDRFFQGGSELKYPLAGTADTGIGLYLCRNIVELYGGTITARNNHRAGCSFRVVLPIQAFGDEIVNEDRKEDNKPAKPLPQETDQNASSITILVVEDNNDMRKYIRTILQDHYTVIEATNGADAIHILMEQNVDFIISDLMMPVMDGVELSRHVKENFAISHIPFLMLTAKTASESRIESYRIGVDDYLLKPFDEDVLLARIEGILRNRRRMHLNFNKEMDVNLLEIANESRDKKFIDQVMEVIKSNYTNSYFEVGDFAEALGISRSLLNKKLQSLLGQSASQFVRNYRMNIARELILKNRVTKAMNISEIAYEVGFNDSKYFTRCFTKQYNITPSAMLNGDSDIQ